MPASPRYGEPTGAVRYAPRDGFSPEEYAARVAAVRVVMAERDLDALLLVSPENIYYLVGLSHQGYFAFTLLILYRDGPPVLVTRSMEQVTVAAQAPDCEHVGFHDDDLPSDTVVRALRSAGVDRGRIAMERDTMFFPPSAWEGIRDGLGAADLQDGSAVVDDIRLVKSPQELACIRQAAALSDRAVRAGMTAAGVGVDIREVAAEVTRSLVLGGSEHPGFVPLVRPATFLLHEHDTWRSHLLVPGDGLFMELSGCVRRYHGPLTRLVHVGHVPPGAERATQVALAAFDAVVAALRPGMLAGQVYAEWQAVVDDALGHDRYRRHHCGYSVGIGFPPSWVGGSQVIGLRPRSRVEIREGMVFHVLSWVIGQLPADHTVSDTVVVTPDGGERITSARRAPIVID